MHYQRVRKHGDPRIVSPVPRGQDHPSWRGDDVSFSAVHGRLRALLGRAADRLCVDCGQAAQHWSYDGTDPSEKEDGEGQNAGRRFSTDPARYVPRCIPCHRRADVISAKLTEADVLAIRGAYALRHTASELARQYGVRQSTVSRIVNRKSWRHI